jgi:hypothetical protein
MWNHNAVGQERKPQRSDLKVYFPQPKSKFGSHRLYPPVRGPPTYGTRENALRILEALGVFCEEAKQLVGFKLRAKTPRQFLLRRVGSGYRRHAPTSYGGGSQKKESPMRDAQTLTFDQLTALFEHCDIFIDTDDNGWTISLG